jgi:hypothetical protein
LTEDRGDPQQTWTIPVPEDQTLIVSAFTARIEFDDGSVLENSSPDRLLFGLDGGHTYVVTVTNGQWKTVKAEDGQREFCYEKAAHEHEWGARYTPPSWPTNVCDQFGE